MEEREAEHNRRVRKHIVEDGVYIPDMGYKYPEFSDESMYNPVKDRSVDIEHNYPFLDKSFKARLLRFGIYLGIFVLMFIAERVKYGLKIKGRKNLFKYRKLFKNGAMTIGNHVHKMDFVFYLQALRYRRLWYPAKAANLESKDHNYIRGTGGIPIPTTFAATKAFNQAFDELHRKKQWIHVYPESCQWPYYQAIRPFNLGAFKMAYRYDLPVIPMVITYRKPGKLRLMLGLKNPCFTVTVGEPLLLNKNEGWTKRQICEDLRKRTHESMVQMAGIVQNCWDC